MKKTIHLYFLLLATLLMYACALPAQSKDPHIKGTIFIDLNTGLFKSELVVSNISSVEEYAILLNKGMNIKYFLDENSQPIRYSGYYNPKVKGEAIEYALLDNEGEALALPKSFKIEYVGAFPKYTNSFNAFDFKGLIAINDKTIRATEQTKWYPVIYDTKKDKLINKYTYNLKIRVEGANSIFINGSPPLKAKKGVFSSNKAVPLLLFAGDYEFVNEKGNYILNGGISKETATKIFENVNIVQSFLEEKLDQKFTDNVYLINHKAVNKRRKGSSWGFNTYPVFAFTGEGFFETIVDEKGKFNNGRYKYFGHEFAHNYFGNNVQSGKLYWFWLESFPDFLSYMIAEEIGGEEYLKKVLLDEVRQLKDKNFVPLTEVENPDDINGTYRYSLGPLILKCFNDTFGRDKIIAVIKSLLKSSYKETLTLGHFKRAAIASGIGELDYNAFEKKFIQNKDFKKNVVDFILETYE